MRRFRFGKRNNIRVVIVLQKPIIEVNHLCALERLVIQSVYARTFG
jgi:hypothetical protein